MEESKGPAAGRYEALKKYREPYLKRAREAAELTVPHLMPAEGDTGNDPLYQPYQSLGARGVRNLASKLLITTLPPTNSFFKYQLDDLMVEELTQQEGMRGEVDKALAKRERAVMQELHKAQFRPAAFEAFRQMIVAGNVVLHIPKKGLSRTFRLDHYCCKRDPQGTLLELVIEEKLATKSLPEDIAAVVKTVDEKVDNGTDEKIINVYTHIVLKGEKYAVYQEVMGHEVPGSRGTYRKEKLPYIALRLTRIDGEDYGRSYVEEFIGDLTALEGLSKAIVEGSAAAAKVLILVNPNGTTKLASVSKSRNLDVISGDANDITVMHVEKNADFSVAKAQAEEISQRLAFAFLLNTSIQRGGDRVTAEEIRYMAGELDDALGGIYSLLGAEFQLPIVPLFEERMQSARKVPGLPEGTASPAIVTGIDALGRGHDLRNLDAFLAGAAQTIGPEQLASYLNVGEYLKRRAASLGIDDSGLIKTQEELQAEQQAAQQAQMMAQMGPNAINQLGNVATTDMKNQAAQQEQPKP